MHLVQLLLPLSENDGQRFPKEDYAHVRDELAGRFGGVTSFTRAPARGMWTEGGHTMRDDLVVFEVMAREIDRPWWESFRAALERRFRQEAIVIRAIKTEML